MATINLGNITIPAGDVADVQAAMSVNFASNGIPAPTQAQCLEYLRQEVIQRIRAITRNYRQGLAAVQDPALS